MATEAQKIAAKCGYTLGKMNAIDNRRLVREPVKGYVNKPYYVAKDGMIVKQFSSAHDRAEWLGEEAIRRGNKTQGRN